MGEQQDEKFEPETHFTQVILWTFAVDTGASFSNIDAP